MANANPGWTEQVANCDKISSFQMQTNPEKKTYTKTATLKL